MGRQGSAVRSRRLLIVGDPASRHGMMELVLSRLGYALTCVATGQEALAAMANTSFALVLLALQLPDLAGLTLARRLRATPGPVGSMPILLFGDAADPERIWECCREARLDGYLPKPLGIERLLSSIRVLSHRLPPEPGELMPTLVPTAVDQDRLTSFTDGDEALERELASLYLATAALYLDQMRTALASGGDWRRTAHALKGASANLGASETARLAAAAEDSAPSSEMLAELAEAVEAVRTYFQGRLRTDLPALHAPLARPA